MLMNNILNTIVARKREEITNNKKKISESTLSNQPLFDRVCFDMALSITEGSGIIAEFKKKSPSKPDIRLDANVSQIALAYEKSGASGLSILTDKGFFGGNDDDVLSVRALVQTPILRKESYS
jgi:indole-3-glycerol phosphate synthase